VPKIMNISSSVFKLSRIKQATVNFPARRTRTRGTCYGNVAGWLSATALLCLNY